MNKGNMVSWMVFWNRKITLGENTNNVWSSVNNNVSILVQSRSLTAERVKDAHILDMS